MDAPYFLTGRRVATRRQPTDADEVWMGFIIFRLGKETIHSPQVGPRGVRFSAGFGDEASYHAANYRPCRHLPSSLAISLAVPS